MDKNREQLCFVKKLGKNIDDNYVYELLFTETIDTFWGENFNVMPSCLCNEIIPDENEFNLTCEIITDIKLDLAIESCCFSFQDVTDGIIPCAWQSLSDLDEYPEDGRLILHFGLTFKEVDEILMNKNIKLNIKEGL